MSKFLVTLNYRSGTSVTIRVDSFKIERGHTARWEGAPNKKWPNIVLRLGLGDIESIFQRLDVESADD